MEFVSDFSLTLSLLVFPLMCYHNQTGVCLIFLIILVRHGRESGSAEMRDAEGTIVTQITILSFIRHCTRYIQREMHFYTGRSRERARSIYKIASFSVITFLLCLQPNLGLWDFCLIATDLETPVDVRVVGGRIEGEAERSGKKKLLVHRGDVGVNPSLRCISCKS